MTRIVNQIAFLFFALSASLRSTPAFAAEPPDHSAFDGILKATVKDQRVDYAAVKQSHLDALNAYLDSLAKIDPVKLDKNDQLAFYINLYNATMIRTIVDRKKPGYSTADNNYGVFKEPLVRLNGKTISLNDLENNVIRATFKDPRIHVALVCGARSCPPILPRAYEGKDIDATLDQNMKSFVADSFRNPIDDRAKTLKLSHIFDWYADDFGGKSAVPAFVGKYAGKDYGGYKVEFVDYSWELNGQK